MKPSSTAERFWVKVDKIGPLPGINPHLGRCWIWKGATNAHGYGSFSNGAVRVLAHRWAYEQKHGAIEHGLELDHLCMVPACVRPSHLEPVSHQENSRRAENVTRQASKRGRARAAAGILPPAVDIQRRKTHCPQGHPYDEKNTTRRRGRRHCKACARARWHKNKAKKLGGQRGQLKASDALMEAEGGDYMTGRAKRRIWGRRAVGGCFGILTLAAATGMVWFFVGVVGPWANRWFGFADTGRAGAAVFGLVLLLMFAFCAGWVISDGD